MSVATGGGNKQTYEEAVGEPDATHRAFDLISPDTEGGPSGAPHRVGRDYWVSIPHNQTKVRKTPLARDVNGLNSLRNHEPRNVSCPANLVP